MSARDERLRDLFFEDLTASGNPSEEGQVRLVSDDLIAYLGGTTKSLTAGAGGGEANTASNVGGEVEVFKQKSGVDLQFRTIDEDGGLNVSQETDTVKVSSGFRWHFLLMGG